MGDVSIRKQAFHQILKTFYRSKCDSKIPSKLLLLYVFYVSLLSVPARSGKRQTRGPSPQLLSRRLRDLQDPARKRADFCRRVRRLIAKIRHQKNTVLTQDSSEPCTNRTLVLKETEMAASTEMVASSPQETWTNSWTCWTSGESFLEEKEQSLDWDFIPTLTTTSNTSLHLAQKSSGPFDDEFPGMTTDYGSLSNIKEMDKEMSFEDMNLSQVLDIDMPADANMSEDEFLNSFMDLSEFLQLPTEQPDEDTVEVKNVIKLEEDLDMHSALVDSVDEIVVCEEPTSPVRSVKREIDEVDMDDCDWSLNMDHDYVTKKPRLSQTPVVETTKETTKKPSKSTQSTSKSASHKLTPDQKYRERRVKNNIASRRSREIRKMKFGEMEEEANRLIVVNSELRTKIEEMEKLAKDMKALLVQKLAAK